MSTVTPPLTMPPPRRWNALGDVHVPPPATPSHRSFGLTVGGVLIAFATFTAWRGHVIRGEVLGGVGGALVAMALIRPSALAWPSRIWGRVGHAFGWFNSRVLLTLMFIVVMWPVGAIARLFGSDPLSRRRTGSLWSDYPTRLRDSKHYERLF